jgi:hypothetical protein
MDVKVIEPPLGAKLRHMTVVATHHLFELGLGVKRARDCLAVIPEPDDGHPGRITG